MKLLKFIYRLKVFIKVDHDIFNVCNLIITFLLIFLFFCFKHKLYNKSKHLNITTYLLFKNWIFYNTCVTKLIDNLCFYCVV